MKQNGEIHDIPIEQITILNPRTRNKRTFASIVTNIEHLGLKRPITITPNSENKFDLVCGQGRLEAYISLGATTIPAIVINTTKEDRYLMSLVENIARRRHKSTELLKEISTLSGRGYTAEQISSKLDLDRGYVSSIAHLLSRGEERLIEAVARGILPLTVAVDICSANDQHVQRALQEAYETGGLRGQKLVNVKRIIAQRARDGKGGSKYSLNAKLLNAQSIVRMYKQTTSEQRAFRARANRTQENLLVITSAMKQLLADEHFVRLLNAEGLCTLPQRLATRIHQVRKAG